MVACLMIMYIAIRLEKWVLQMAKEPVKCIIICCSLLLLLLPEKFEFLKSLCMMSVKVLPYTLYGGEEGTA